MVFALTLRHLQIFICVCDELSMTKTAEKLHMTQPSVSQAIHEIEDHYKVRLFERLGRNLFITDAGNNLLTYARHFVNLSTEIENAMQKFGKQYMIRIGASVTIGECVLIDLIKKLHIEYPEYQIKFEIHNTRVLEKMVLSDKLDIALVEGKIKSEYLIADAFLDDELVFIASPDLELMKKDKIEIADIEKMNFFVREEGSGTRNLFDQVMESKEIKCNIVGVYNNADTIKKAVLAGLGISVISRCAVRNEIKSGELSEFKMKNINFKRKFHIVYHKNKYLSQGIKNIMEICKKMSE